MKLFLNKKNKYINKYILGAIFALFLIFQASNAFAEDALIDCICKDSSKKVLQTFKESVTSVEGCTNKCKSISGATYAAADFGALSGGEREVPIGNIAQDQTAPATTPSSMFKTLFGDPIFQVFKWLLYGVLQLVGLLVGIAGSLFDWVVRPENLTGILNKQSIVAVWTLVRDLLNMLFIMVLLWSAFGTIFQTGTHIKNIWFKVLLNALLVNFSYPISRFIIDLGNITMYYFLNQVFDRSSGFFANISNYSGIQNILVPGNYAQYEISYLIAAIIFVFIFGITMFVFALLFVIRLVALAILIMFSPIGFVGYIFPSLNSYAKKYWDQLIKYTMAGPILTFFMIVSFKIMQEMSEKNVMGTFISAAKNGAVDTAQANWVAGAAFFTIPIVLLWAGIGVSLEGIKFSTKIQGYAGKIADWGKSMAWMPVKATGIPGGIKQAKEHYKKRGVRLPFTNARVGGSDQVDTVNDWAAKKFGVPVKPKDLVKERAEQIKASMDFDAMGKLDESLRNDAFKKANLDKQLAIVSGLAEKGKATKEMTKWVVDNKDKIPMAKEVFDKIKEKSPHFALAHMLDANGNPDKDGQKMLKRFKSEDLTDDMLNDPKFIQSYIDVGKMDKKAVDGLTDNERDTYQKTVTKIIDDMKGEAKNMSKAKNLQVQHLALAGTLHSSIMHKGDPDSDKARKEIWAKLNKDNVGKIDNKVIDNYYEEIAENIKNDKLVEVVKSIGKNSDQKLFVEKIYNHPGTSQNIKNLIEQDPFLKNFKPKSTSTSTP